MHVGDVGVPVCLCVRHCPARQKAKQTAAPCWQGNTAGCLITACARQALTGASPLLTNQSVTPDALCVFTCAQALCIRACVCVSAHHK